MFEPDGGHVDPSGVTAAYAAGARQAGAEIIRVCPGNTGMSSPKRSAYPMQQDIGAVFGLNAGWENLLYFDAEVSDLARFIRQNWFDIAGREARIPRAVACHRLTPLIGVRGWIAGDFTVTRMAAAEFRVIGSDMAERYHQSFWAMASLPGDTTFTSLTDAICRFNLTGLLVRKTLQSLIKTCLETADLPFLRSAWIDVAGARCLALRVSFTGDLGWKIHCDSADQVTVYRALLGAACQLRADGPADPEGTRIVVP